ncbi:MAG TPA: hypothetical protein VM367_00725 [Pseudonocardia sp.]|jgi:hypothetical protein|nr:hypothetical protein [Pseudonocardia sp.]
MHSSIRTGLAATAGAAVTVATLWVTGTALADPGTPTPPPEPGRSAPVEAGVPAPNRFGPGEIAPPPARVAPDGSTVPAPGEPGHVPPHAGVPGVPVPPPAPGVRGPAALHGPASEVRVRPRAR